MFLHAHVGTRVKMGEAAMWLAGCLEAGGPQPTSAGEMSFPNSGGMGVQRPECP